MPDIPASNQLELKLRLERTFRREIRSIFAAQAKVFRQLLKEDPLGRFISVNSAPEWVKVLEKHYGRVQKKFSHVNFDELPDDFDEEEYLLLLLMWRRLQARKKSLLIAATDEKVKNNALRKAQLFFVDKPEPSLNEFSLVAAAGMRKINKGRVGKIATTETQFAAESGKYIEASYFDKKTPKPADPEKEKPQIKKMWQTMEDRRVRKDHYIANKQLKNLEKPFIVGNERLMFPGDDSLGATAKNIIDCRCFAIYKGTKKQLEALRRQGIDLGTRQRFE